MNILPAGTGVAVGVGEGDADGVGDAVAVGDAVGVAVTVGEAVGVAVTVGVGVGVGDAPPSSSDPESLPGPDGRAWPSMSVAGPLPSGIGRPRRLPSGGSRAALEFAAFLYGRAAPPRFRSDVAQAWPFHTLFE